MDAVDTRGIQQLLELLEQRSLSVGVRGYDRAETDELLGKLEEGLKATLQQHAASLARVGELERRIAEGQGREEAVTEALVLATQIRADSEREGKELKDKLELEGQAIKREAERTADEIVNKAETEAAAIVGEARIEASTFDQRIRDAEDLAHRIQDHLTSFLQSMLTEVERRNEESVSIVGDLLDRAGEAAKPEHDGTPDVAAVARGGSRRTSHAGAESNSVDDPDV